MKHRNCHCSAFPVVISLEKKERDNIHYQKIPMGNKPRKYDTGQIWECEESRREITFMDKYDITYIETIKTAKPYPTVQTLDKKRSIFGRWARETKAVRIK